MKSNFLSLYTVISTGTGLPAKDFVLSLNALQNSIMFKIGRAHVRTPVTSQSRMPSSAWKKKYFPGYVLIKSEMDNDIYHMIKNIKRVSGFLGTKGIPVPVSDKEIEKILGQIKDGVAQPKSGIEYSVGEKVQVVDGPFASFSGMVEDIDEEKSRLKVSVSIFGRPTPVDLEYNQVEKVS